MARMQPMEIFIFLMLGMVLLYLFSAFGGVGLVDEYLPSGVTVPPLMTVIKLFIISFGMILVAKLIIGNPTKQKMIVYVMIAAGLAAAWYFLPEILPPELQALVRQLG